MVDYWITEVCYSRDPAYIYSVRIYYNARGPYSASTKLKNEVVDLINRGYVIYTEVNGRQGARVRTFRHPNGNYYLRTDPDNRPEDNLGSLPRFC